MIEEPPLLRIKSTRQRPTDQQIAAFQGVATGFVNDALDGAGALSSRIAPLPEQEGQVAGPALTCDSGPGDILALLALLKFTQPGDIAVNAFAGYQEAATAGDRVTGMLRNAGAAALVTDGPTRDHAGIRAVGLPVWCTGLTPASPVSKGPGTVGFPVQLGGQQVATGDMIVADRDGVVVVPFAKIDTVIERLDHIRTLEDALDAEVANGLAIPLSITELLESDQVQYSD
ncbi:MAG: RraA family protein [Pseudomonadota bacterium]